MAPVSREAPIHERSEIRDRHGRSLRSLRLSVIDRCDLRCSYCMPEETYTWLPASDILEFAEIAGIAAAFLEVGVDRMRLTGGEPLLRAGLPELVELLTADPRLADLAMTTNGTQLERWAEPLRQAGLHRVTVSLDTLRPDRFRALTRRDALSRVLAGIDAAATVGYAALKLNTVVVRGFNDDELVPLLEYGRRVNAEVRFIEYMDVGGATRWSTTRVVPRAEILDLLAAHCGPVVPEEEPGATAPADRYRLPDGTRFGIVSSVTEPFCRSCDRSRLTADGRWYLCLYAGEGIDLRAAWRRGGTEAVLDLIRPAWLARTDRAAEERSRDPHRGVLFPVEALKLDPHREMHTRGG